METPEEQGRTSEDIWWMSGKRQVRGDEGGPWGTDPDSSEGNEAADVRWEDLSSDPNTIKHLLSVLLLKCTDARIGLVCSR